MITVGFWSEHEQGWFCQWDNGSGFLNEDDLNYEESMGEEILWQ